MRRSSPFLRQWIKDHAGSNVTTDQFIALAEQVSGMALGDLFDAWLFTPSKPALGGGTELRPLPLARSRVDARHLPRVMRSQLQRYGQDLMQRLFSSTP